MPLPQPELASYTLLTALLVSISPSQLASRPPNLGKLNARYSLLRLLSKMVLSTKHVAPVDAASPRILS